MTVVEWRPNGHIRLEISPAILGVWVEYQGQTNCLQVSYVPSLLTASQGLGIIARHSPTRH